ncbi:MAG: ABC transporter substrate-binding protein [Candidatus Rokubacteria bacterium]|nr:ABC transporter substrate-binding protein [Candidatus Rokubacteria bacterium]
MMTRMNRRAFLKAAGRAAAAFPLAGTALRPRRARAQEPRTLVVTWDSDIDTLDPAHFKAMGGYVTVANCYDTPIAWKVRPIEGKPGFYRSHPGEFDPMICESWSSEADGATIVFKVRRGAKFASGRPVTAHAVKYCFDRGLQSPGYMRIVIPSLIQVNAPEQFEVRDDYTFAIKMKAPSPMALDIVALSNNAILDPEEVKAHATKDDPWAAEWLKRNVAGVGPYRLAKNEPGVEIVLEATKGYWRPAPYFERIVFKFVPNEADRVLLIKRKAIDMVVGRPGLTPKNVKSLEGEPGLKVFSVPDTTCHFIAMNTQKPPFDNVKVRQAVNYAIPIQAILPSVLYGYATQMTTPIPHLTPGHLGTLSPYKHDIDKARQLMKDAGALDKAPIPVDLAIRVGFVAHEQASIWIQHELEKIGFKVNIVKETDATFRQVAIKGGHTLSMEAWQSWVNDPWYHLLFNFHSKSKFTNMPFYSNPALDRLIDENMHEVNTQKRIAAVREAQKILVDDAVWGFLWYDSWTRVMKADLVGLEKRWDTFERYYAVKRA